MIHKRREMSSMYNAPPTPAPPPAILHSNHFETRVIEKMVHHRREIQYADRYMKGGRWEFGGVTGR